MVNLVNSCALVLAISSLMMIFMMSAPLSAVDASGDHHLNLGWLPTGSSLVGEEEEGEFELDSETNRRILATSNYISYGALQRNTVPCSRRGASYYNCQNGGQANPYNRGCSTITRCRSWVEFQIFNFIFIKWGCDVILGNLGALSSAEK